MAAVITVLQAGDTTKPHPYTIAIIANPALEKTKGSGVFIADPILGNQAGFDASAKYVFDVLFGRLPQQAEKLLADPTLGPKIRVVKVFDSGLLPTDGNALVTQTPPNLAETRRDKFNAFLAVNSIVADVAFAVTGSTTHIRASAWYTTEDTTRGGTSFTLDGVVVKHWNFCKIPGTVALPMTSNSLTALHEFGHAASSFNDQVTDQYVDSDPGLNNKRGRPIPAGFSTLNGTVFNSDPTRTSLNGYPAGWSSYHPELSDPAMPSLMDNYWAAPGGIPEKCRFDKLTRKFFFDRLTVKLAATLTARVE